MADVSGIFRLAVDTKLVDGGKHIGKFVNATRLAIESIKGMANAAKVASIEFQNFEKALTEVTTLVDGDEFDNFKDGIDDLSRRIGVDAVNASRALYQTISAGIRDTGDAIEFMDVATKSAIAGVTDLATAVDGLTTVVNSYRLSSLEYDKVASAMFETVKLGKLRFDDLSKAMSTALPMAANMGIAYEDILAATATLTKQGFTASEAMIQIRSALRSIINPTKEMTALYRKLGVVTGTELIQKFGSFQKALVAVNKAAAGNDQLLNKAIRRVEAYQALLGLTGKNANEAASDLTNVTVSLDAHIDAFEKLNKLRPFQVLSENINIIKRDIGQAITEPVRDAVRAFNELAFMPSEVEKNLSTHIKTKSEAILKNYKENGIEPIKVEFQNLKKEIAAIQQTFDQTNERIRENGHMMSDSQEMIKLGRKEFQVYNEILRKTGVGLEGFNATSGGLFDSQEGLAHVLKVLNKELKLYDKLVTHAEKNSKKFDRAIAGMITNVRDLKEIKAELYGDLYSPGIMFWEDLTQRMDEFNRGLAETDRLAKSTKELDIFSSQLLLERQTLQAELDKKMTIKRAKSAEEIFNAEVDYKIKLNEFAEQNTISAFNAEMDRLIRLERKSFGSEADVNKIKHKFEQQIHDLKVKNIKERADLESTKKDLPTGRKKKAPEIEENKELQNDLNKIFNVAEAQRNQKQKQNLLNRQKFTALAFAQSNEERTRIDQQYENRRIQLENRTSTRIREILHQAAVRKMELEGATDRQIHDFRMQFRDQEVIRQTEIDNQTEIRHQEQTSQLNKVIALTEYLNGLRLAALERQKELTEAIGGMASLTGDISSGMNDLIQAYGTIEQGGKRVHNGLGQILSRMSNWFQFISKIAKMYEQIRLAQAAQSAGQMFGPIGGAIGAGAGALAMLGSLFMHSGGPIQKLHNGGAPKGLRSDEVPIIAQTGEYMLSRKAVQNMGGQSAVDQMHQDAMNGMGGTNVNLNLSFDPDNFRSYITGTEEGKDIVKQAIIGAFPT